MGQDEKKPPEGGVLGRVRRVFQSLFLLNRPPVASLQQRIEDFCSGKTPHLVLYGDEKINWVGLDGQQVDPVQQHH